MMKLLTQEEIGEQAELGKVGFNRKYNDRQVDVTKAVETAIQAYTDGIVRVFHGDTEMVSLDAPLDLKEGDFFTFIRFTMLAGRMW